MGFCDVSLNRLRLSGIWEVPWSGGARVRGNLGQWLVTIWYRNISVYLTNGTRRLWWPSTAHGNNIIEEADNDKISKIRVRVRSMVLCAMKKKKKKIEERVRRRHGRGRHKEKDTACSLHRRALSRSYMLHLKPVAQNLVTRPHRAAWEDGKYRLHSEKPCAQPL